MLFKSYWLKGSMNRFLVSTTTIVGVWLPSGCGMFFRMIYFPKSLYIILSLIIVEKRFVSENMNTSSSSCSDTKKVFLDLITAVDVFRTRIDLIIKISSHDPNRIPRVNPNGILLLFGADGESGFAISLFWTVQSELYSPWYVKRVVQRIVMHTQCSNNANSNKWRYCTYRTTGDASAATWEKGYDDSSWTPETIATVYTVLKSCGKRRALRVVHIIKWTG